MDIKTFKKKWPSFRKWLVAHGSEVLHTTNMYEAARFTTTTGVGIIYKNKNEMLTKWIGGAEDAWKAFVDQKPYNVKQKRKNRGAIRRKILIMSIAVRDGWECMYCGKILDMDTATIEHIVPIARSGFDGISNMTLACSKCNKTVGHMSAREKVEYAILHRQ